MTSLPPGAYLTDCTRRRASPEFAVLSSSMRTTGVVVAAVFPGWPTSRVRAVTPTAVAPVAVLRCCTASNLEIDVTSGSAMPRRSPATVRAAFQPRRRSWLARSSAAPAFHGLPLSTQRKIRDFERRNGLEPGAVTYAFRAWKATGKRRNLRWGDQPTCYEDATQAESGRTLLERACLALPSKHRRKLRTLLRQPDAARYAQSIQDPFAPPEWPWWLRRTRV